MRGVHGFDDGTGLRIQYDKWQNTSRFVSRSILLLVADGATQLKEEGTRNNIRYTLKSGTKALHSMFNNRISSNTYYSGHTVDTSGRRTTSLS